MSSKQVTPLELSKLAGLSVSRLRELSRQGLFPRLKAGRYDLAAAMGGLVKYYKERRESVGPELREEQTRLVRAQADLLTLKRQDMERALVPIDAVMEVWGKMVEAMREIISRSKLREQEKADLLADLKPIPAEEYFKTPAPYDADLDPKLYADTPAASS